MMRLAQAGRRPVAGQVEVEEQRVAVGRQQDVGRLDVSVGHVAAKRVVECLGQPGADPRDRLAVGEARQHFTSRPRRVNGRKLGGGDGIKVREQVDPRSRASCRLAARAASTAARVAPPQNGMQINWNASSSTVACDTISTMWACRTRARSHGSRVILVDTLSTTRRFSRLVCSARNTRAKPPRPSSRRKT